MKISIDGKLLFEITDLQKKVIKDYMKSEIFEEDIKRRLFWVINEVYKESFKRMQARWDKKLKEVGIESVPVDKDAYAELVFSQSDYKDRTARDAEITEKLRVRDGVKKG